MNRNLLKRFSIIGGAIMQMTDDLIEPYFPNSDKVLANFQGQSKKLLRGKSYPALM